MTVDVILSEEDMLFIKETLAAHGGESFASFAHSALVDAAIEMDCRS